MQHLEACEVASMIWQGVYSVTRWGDYYWCVKIHSPDGPRHFIPDRPPESICPECQMPTWGSEYRFCQCDDAEEE